MMWVISFNTFVLCIGTQIYENQPGVGHLFTFVLYNIGTQIYNILPDFPIRINKFIEVNQMWVISFLMVRNLPDLFPKHSSME